MTHLAQQRGEQNIKYRYISLYNILHKNVFFKLTDMNHDWAQIWVISARNHDVVAYTYSI